LQFLKDQLKVWNREHFGNIFSGRVVVEEKLTTLGLRVIEHGMFEVDFQEEKRLRKELEEWLAREEAFWR
jgi:hypothetical protein